MTKKRNRLAAKKVEELTLIKANKAQIEAFKERGSYELVAGIGGSSALTTITVDEVIENMVIGEDSSSSESESEAEDSTDYSDDDQ